MSAEHSEIAAAAGVQIRRFRPRDARSLRNIIEASPEAAHWSVEGISHPAPDAAELWVAEDAGLINGFLAARCVAHECEILNLAVSPQSRRRGVARQLLRTALERAKGTGCTKVYLEVRASNDAALALYARHGFRECGRRPRYYRQPEEDALVLVLTLASENRTGT